MTRAHVAAVLAAVLTAWMTKPGQALAALALVVLVVVGGAELLAWHRRGLRRLERAGRR